MRLPLLSAVNNLHFATTVDEETAWTNEKIKMLDAESPRNDQLEAVRDQLQKLENLQIDIAGHKSRTSTLAEGRPNEPRIIDLYERVSTLEKKLIEKNKEVLSNESFLSYKRKCQNCNDWIQDRLRRLDTENITGDNMAMVTAFFTKQNNLEDSMKSYDSEGIQPTKGKGSTFSSYFKKGGIFLLKRLPSFLHS